jgi:uncharacterized lipoprotein YbaY
MTDEIIEREMRRVSLHAAITTWDHAAWIAQMRHGVTLEDTPLITEQRAEYAALIAPKEIAA